MRHVILRRTPWHAAQHCTSGEGRVAAGLLFCAYMFLVASLFSF
jgi:hypothetical protein